MANKIERKSWSEQEIEYLAIGYNLGAPLKTLSIVFKRSESALNKALTRLGIRQYGAQARGKKPQHLQSVTITPNRLKDEIEKFKKEKGKCSLLLQKSKKETGLSLQKGKLPSSFVNFPLRQKKLSTPLWSNLDYAVSILEKKGHKVSRMQNGYPGSKGQEAKFWFDGLPMTPAQLLVQANRVRLEKGLEPFYVDTITEY